MKSVKSRFGAVIILRNSLFVVTGSSLLKDLLFKTIALMTNSQVHHQEIWEIRDLFQSRKEIKVDTEDSKLNYSLELMVIGRLSLFYHHILSSIMDSDSLMVIVIALCALMILADNNAKIQYQNKLHTIQTVVVMIASKMEVGLLTDTLEFIEIYQSLRR